MRKDVVAGQRGKGNWCEDWTSGLLNSSELDFMGHSLNFYGIFSLFLSNTHFSVQTVEIRGEIVLGCFKSKWTELPRCASFNIHGLSYMTLLLQVEQVTAILFIQACYDM